MHGNLWRRGAILIITPCAQNSDVEGLLCQLEALKVQSGQEQIEKTRALVAKSLPLLERCGQHKQMSLRRVFDIFLYAQQPRAAPEYCKKGFLRRSIIVDKTEFYILLKSKGSEPDESSTRRLTRAVRVPFEGEPSLVYQFVNRDGCSKLSVQEIQTRTIWSRHACGKLKDQCPKVVTAYSYVKNGKFQKACAFIETKEFLCAFKPSCDRHKNFALPDIFLLDYVKTGDVDSIRFIVEHLRVESRYYNFPTAFREAVRLKQCETVKVLVDKKILEDSCLMEALERADECGVIEHIINACKDRQKALETAYESAARKSFELLQDVSKLGKVSQESHLEALRVADDMRSVQWIASQVEDLPEHGGEAMEQAAYGQNWQKVFFLLDQGVDVNFCADNDGVTVLSHAVAGEETEASLEAAKKLLDRAADPYILDEDGHPVIYWAKKNGNERAVALLLSYSKKPEADQEIISSVVPAASSDEESF